MINTKKRDGSDSLDELVGFLYRDHCGSLADSMKTTKRFGSLNELEKYVRGMFGMRGDEEITTKPYAFDERIGWYTHIVLANGSVVGFTNGQPNENGDSCGR